jgi:hypothetical protein
LGTILFIAKMKGLLVNALLIVACVQLALATSYVNSEVLSDHYTIYWNIVNDEIQLKLSVKTTGWVV